MQVKGQPDQGMLGGFLSGSQALKADEGLIVVAPFLPSPLVERLSGEGFASKVERGQGADWLVYFWREVA